MSGSIYLDYSATTPIDPRVLEAMLPYFREKFGNAASRNHRYGHEAEEAVERSRRQVASLINAQPDEIIWTSGATESDNIAVKGIAHMYQDRGGHIVTQGTEHKAVIDPCKYLEREGFEVTYLPVDKAGRIDLDQLQAAFRNDTILVSIMFANNEIGTIQPIAEIAGLCKQKGVIFHTDAAQAFGKVPIDVESMEIDLLSCSAHKVYGPKGVGALYIRRRRPRVRCAPVLHGGGHEQGLRPGTLDVPGIVGMAAAAELAQEEMEGEAEREARLRDRLWEALSEKLEEIHRNGHPVHCLPNTLNLSFAYVEGEAIMLGMPDIAVSSGSACTSASLEPSHVLRALGVGEELAHGSIRFSLGRFTTAAQIEETIDQVSQTVIRLRERSPLYEMAKEGIELDSVKWGSTKQA